jgi:hypothetical protein
MRTSRNKEEEEEDDDEEEEEKKKGKLATRYLNAMLRTALKKHSSNHFDLHIRRFNAITCNMKIKITFSTLTSVSHFLLISI